MDKKVVTWVGPVPEACDICHNPIKNTFVDGKTNMGPWGNMCSNCHKHHGCGLGTGRGQEFKKQSNGYWIKVKG